MEGKAVAFLFRFDPAVVVGVLEQGRDGGPPVRPSEVEGERARFRRYLDEHFSVSNDGARCPAGDFIALHYNPSLDTVVLTLRFDCAAEPNVLVFESTLFLDLRMRHELIGDFRYGHAHERYFFNYVEKKASIRVRELYQVDLPIRYGFGRTAVRRACIVSHPPAAPHPRRAPDPEQPLEQPELSSDFLGGVETAGGPAQLLLLLSLGVAARRLRPLALAMAAFTGGWMLTLALGARGLLVPRPALLDVLVAASVVCIAVAMGVVRGRAVPAPVLLVLGLPHGLVFREALAGNGAPSSPPMAALVMFALGGVVVQLAFALLAFALAQRLRRSVSEPRLSVVSGAATILLALAWLAARLHG